MLKLFAGTAIAAACAVLPAQAQAATLIVDVAGSQAVAGFRAGGNTVRTFDIGAGSRVTSIAYVVTITANVPSYLSEATVALTGSAAGSAGVFLSPGAADDASGTGDYAGTVDLSDAGLDFTVGTDGLLRFEYFDSFIDGASPDSVWNRGTLTVTYDGIAAPSAVPEPTTWAMLTLGFGIVGGAMRRARTKAATAPAC